MSLAVLVKADLMYVLPACLLLALLMVASQQRATVVRCAAVVFVCYAVVLGA